MILFFRSKRQPILRSKGFSLFLLGFAVLWLAAGYFALQVYTAQWPYWFLFGDPWCKGANPSPICLRHVPSPWIPAFAGMTSVFMSVYDEFGEIRGRQIMAKTGGYLVWIKFDVKDGMMEEFIAGAVADAEASVANEPGCHEFKVITPEDEPNRAYLYEVYDDAEAHAQHRASPQYASFAKVVQKTVIERRRTIMTVHNP